MDENRFDNLTRSLAAGTSRRTLLRGLAGGLAGLVAGAVARTDAGVAAQELTICHATGDPNAPYQTMTIPRTEMNLHARQGDFVRVECCADSDCPNQYGECGRGTCTNGYCVQLPVAAGSPCDPGLACVTSGVCDGAFTCTASGAPVVCAETESPCTTAICSEEAGGCQEIPANVGMPCGAGPSCADGTQHSRDVCDGGGTCVSGANTGCGLYVCGTTSCRTTCGGDADCVGAAHCDGGVCMGDSANGVACDEASDCQSGFCNSVSAFCCSQNCAAGVDCTGAGFTCGVPPCGAVGQTCCAGEVCNGGAHCDGGSCVANLANGQPCDEHSDCQSGICNATSSICCAQSCGAGVACVGAGSTCDDPTCGGPGQACCAGNACDSGACSQNFACEPCGDLYDICCFDSHNIPHCNGGLGCNSRACWPVECGGPNEACCEGTLCQNGLFCDAGQICRVPCGGNGQACCAGGTCGGGLACGGQTCRPCGGSGQACCAGDVCGAGLECGASFSGNLTQCVSNCGGSGEICCREGGAAVCDTGLECNSNARCVADGCGRPGQECCYLRECDGAPCSINHMCEPCGDEVGQPCCFANVQYCNAPLFCPGRTCAS